MQVRWYLCRFDYERYLWLRPRLRAATMPEAFAELSEGPEEDAIVDALEEEEFPLPEARAAMVQSLCCKGDPIPFDSGLVRLITLMRRVKELEDASELLNEVLNGKKNLEPWLMPSAALAGFLTPQEVSGFYAAWISAPAGARRRAGLSRRQRRGLLNAGAGLLRNLWGGGPQPAEALRLLIGLLEEGEQREEGIVVINA